MTYRSRRFGMLLLALALPVLAADGLQVKTGLWDTTVVTNMGGMTLPPEVTAKMSPEQRAQMEQMIKQRAGTPRTIREKSCVTEKDLKEGVFKNTTSQQNCKYTTVSASARRQEMTFECTTAGHKGNGHMVMEAPDSTHVNGAVDVKSDVVNVSIKITSQWVSSSCEGADKD